MLNFKKVEITDIDTIKQIIEKSGEFSCENAFINLLVWQCAYNNEFAIENGNLFIKSGKEPKESYRLPIGNDLEDGMKTLLEYCKGKEPHFWVQEGPSLYKFKEKFSDKFVFIENRDAFDYLYLRDDLAYLKGKKYHSKRNHISAFSKKFDWKYESITNENIEKVKLCAEKWYKQNSQKLDFYMQCEKQGIEMLLNNFERLALKGGAILVDGEVVAFTLGSEINSEIFDTHIEKALPWFAEAYTVINREFALNELSGYKYINREDDMGLAGLRKAKLSYKPAILLKKYLCMPKEQYEKIKQQCREIYRQAFAEEDTAFEDKLFNTNFRHCRYLVENGQVVSMLFALPCEIICQNSKKDALYIFAAVTRKDCRKKGYMSHLLAKTVNGSQEVCFLRPATKELEQYYVNQGFVSAQAVNFAQQDCNIVPAGSFAEFVNDFGQDENKEEFTLMFYNEENLPSSTVGFEFSME